MDFPASYAGVENERVEVGAATITGKPALACHFGSS